MNDFSDDGDFNDDSTFDIGWQDIAMLGALSEQIADEESEILRIEHEMDKEEDEENI